MSNAGHVVRRSALHVHVARWRAALVVVLAAIVTSGCGSIVLRSADAPPVEPEVTTMPPVEASRIPDALPAPKPEAPRMQEPATPKPAQRRITRGGRYFQDDGPGDIAPELLLATPEPTPRHEPLAHFANNPYRAFGKPYSPAKARKPWTERGVASWYGRKFHGRRTATGERYDMYALSAAHPTLPLPSFVRVKSVETGRSIVVRVNDRGPFLRNRIIDLSYAAAAKLGFAHKGSAPVEIEAILPGVPGSGQVAMGAGP